MKKLLLSSLLGILLLTDQAVFSQSMTNTSHSITLTNSCLTVTTGTYTLDISYYDIDNNDDVSASVTCAVTNDGAGEIVISTNDLTFPTADVNGYWNLADAWPGHMYLTAAGVSAALFWWQNPDGSIGFNCTPLGIATANALPWL